MKYTHLTDYEIKKIIRCFVPDLSVTQTSIFSCVNRNIINSYFRILIETILKFLEKDKLNKMNGEPEIDEGCFGAKRVIGKRVRGTAEKIIVFGVLTRGDEVYLEITNRAIREELMVVIQGKILECDII